jgi:hypothetical protein
MKNNRIIWGFVAVLILITIAVSFGTTSYSQKETPREQSNNPFGDLSKYPVADYNAPESANTAEREERRIKNKRYDKKLLVLAKPGPEDTAVIVSDANRCLRLFPLRKAVLSSLEKYQTRKPHSQTTNRVFTRNIP